MINGADQLESLIPGFTPERDTLLTGDWAPLIHLY